MPVEIQTLEWCIDVHIPFDTLTQNYRKIQPFLMGKLTTSIAIFSSYVTNHQRNIFQILALISNILHCFQFHLGIYLVNSWLVVWNMTFIFPYMGNSHPNWRTHIFQSAGSTTNQIASNPRPAGAVSTPSKRRRARRCCSATGRGVVGGLRHRPRRRSSGRNLGWLMKLGD